MPLSAIYGVKVSEETTAPPTEAEQVAHASWCTEDSHHYDTGQCVSPAVEIGQRACWVWLERPMSGGDEPTFVIDTPRDGANLTLEEAQQLCATLDWLARAARRDRGR